MQPLVGFVPPKLLPAHLLAWFLLGKWSSAQLRSELTAALATSSNSILNERLKAALQVDLTDNVRNLKLPMLYLQASEDRIVPNITGDELVRSALNGSLVEIQGPHMLLQAAPKLCAEAVRRFVATL
jgi:pimeloyl-ACP methyl ester carboxylesterase